MRKIVLRIEQFISSASDKKRKKIKIKQLYNTTQRKEKHRHRRLLRKRIFHGFCVF